jgi:hypothetical protein
MADNEPTVFEVPQREINRSYSMADAADCPECGEPELVKCGRCATCRCCGYSLCSR